jgi:chromosome segregation ATPase
VLDQRILLLEQELRSRAELSKEHQQQLETLSVMLDEAKEKEVQKNAKINELSKLLSDEVNRADRLREQLRSLEEQDRLRQRVEGELHELQQNYSKLHEKYYSTNVGLYKNDHEQRTSTIKPAEFFDEFSNSNRFAEDEPQSTLNRSLAPMTPIKDERSVYAEHDDPRYYTLKFSSNG